MKLTIFKCEDLFELQVFNQLDEIITDGLLVNSIYLIEQGLTEFVDGEPFEITDEQADAIIREYNNY